MQLPHWEGERWPGWAQGRFSGSTAFSPTSRHTTRDLRRREPSRMLASCLP